MIRPFLLLSSLALSPLASGADVPPPPSTGTTASAKEPFGVGTIAPAFKPEKWLKGEAVTAFANDKVYLVECWATWCGPCVAQIPHLNDLHNQFKDQGLVVIGVNVMGDPEEKAAAFVARKGDKMAYRVAYDGKTGSIAKDWLEAAGVRGIPHSFLVRESKILWHGHPSALTVDNIRGVLQGGTIATVSPAGQAKLDETVATYRLARLEVLACLRGGEGDKALAKISEKEKILSATDPADPDLLRGMAYSILGDKEKSLAHYMKAVKAGKGDAGVLFRVAHGLLDYGSVRDDGLALECARAAANIDAKPIFLHMQARAENAAGNKEVAINILEKLAEEEESGMYREELRALKENKPFPPSVEASHGRQPSP